MRDGENLFPHDYRKLQMQFSSARKDPLSVSSALVTRIFFPLASSTLAPLTSPYPPSYRAITKNCISTELYWEKIAREKRVNAKLIELYDENHWRSASLPPGFCILHPRVGSGYGRVQMNCDAPFGITFPSICFFKRNFQILFP